MANKVLTEFIKKIYLFLSKHKSAIFYLLLVILFLLSVFPRSIEIFNQNPVFGFDQGRDYLAVKSIVVDRKLTLIGAELGAGAAGLSGIFQGPFYYYLLTIPFILFNGNPVGGNYLMFVLGILTIVAGYYLGKKLFGGWGGMLVGLLISISPILIGESRFIWNPHCPPLFIILTFIFFYFFVSTKKGPYIFLAAFFAGFIYNFETAVSVPVSLTLGLFSIFLFKKNFKYYLYLFFGFLLAFSPTILFEARHNFVAVTGMISYFSGHTEMSGAPSSLYVVNHLRAFVDNFRESFPITGFNLSLICLIAIILQSAFLLVRETNKNLKRIIFLMLLLIPVNYFVFNFLKNWLWTYYLTDLTIVYIFLLTYIAYSFFSKKRYKSGALMLSLITFLILIGFINAFKVSLRDYSDYGGNAKLKGKMDAVDYIYKQANNKPFGLLVYSPPIYIYPYDYLIWWYGERKYGYTPHKEKVGNVYLLIEVDTYQPWTYKGWLETVIRDGEIVRTVTLPSGLIVQERKFN
jgi:hypothetical protein